MALKQVTLQIQRIINESMFRIFPPTPNWIVLGPSSINHRPRDEDRQDSILWAVPKRRRSIERRMTRRFGALEWGTSKLIPVNRKIRTDNITGEFFELGKLAPRTYRRIMTETLEIQRKMADVLGRSPKDKRVVLRYQGEKNKDDQFGRRSNEDDVVVVEMEKPRPQFFSKNLMQKSAKAETDISTTTVRPSGLG